MFNPEGGQDICVLTLVTRRATHLGKETGTQKTQGESPLALTTADRHLQWHLQHKNSGIFFPEGFKCFSSLPTLQKMLFPPPKLQTDLVNTQKPD